MKTPTLPYPGHADLTSGSLSGGGYRVAYQDISPSLINYVSNITIAKGHRILSGFFGFGIPIAGFLDRLLDIPDQPFSLTAGFGLLTSIIMIFIFFTRNITISQLMKILKHHVHEEGFPVLSHNPDVKKELAEFEESCYSIRIPSPMFMLKGVELIPIRKNGDCRD